MKKGMKVTVCQGIPASGKSTWAREQVRLSGGKTKRINRDDLRAMIDDSVWSRPNENHINHLRRFLISYFIDAGYDVIVDDTNLKSSQIKDLREHVERCNATAEFRVKLFDTPLEICLERNAKRTGREFVPEDVIRRFHKELREALDRESAQDQTTEQTV